MEPESSSKTEAESIITPPQETGPAPLKQIRTFEGDVADAIKKQNESLITIARAEEKKREAIKTLTPESSSPEVQSGGMRALVMALLTILFLGGGGYGAYYVWITYSVKTSIPVTSTPGNQFVSAATLTNIDASVLGRQAILELMTRTREGNRETNSIEQLELRRGSKPDAELLTTADFLTRLASRAPNPLVRSFNPLFMLGVLGGNPGHSILLIKLDSFENAFPGMLEWESRIIVDILPLIGDEVVVQNVPSSSEFADKTIQNHDTRVLKDSNGRTVLIYGFFDNSMLIVTDNEESFRTLINRLQSEKLSR